MSWLFSNKLWCAENVRCWREFCRWQQGFVPLSRYPEYFESYGRKEPQAINHVPITFAAGKPDMGYFDMLSSNPARLNRFMKAMASTSSSIPIAGIYDFSWLVDTVKENPNLDRAVLVDVGGGMGHAIKAIHGEFPQLPLGRFVLQDTPDTVEAGKALNEPELAQIQRLAINFHKEPPVRGRSQSRHTPHKAYRMGSK